MLIRFMASARGDFFNNLDIFCDFKIYLLKIID